jgi:hypothetical protein
MFGFMPAIEKMGDSSAAVERMDGFEIDDVINDPLRFFTTEAAAACDSGFVTIIFFIEFKVGFSFDRINGLMGFGC